MFRRVVATQRETALLTHITSALHLRRKRSLFHCGARDFAAFDIER